MGGVFAECRDGDGVFKMLPCWLSLLLRMRRQKKIKAARMSPAPSTAPMTIPAIAPPESPDPDPDPPVAAPFEGVGEEVEVLLGKSGGIDTVVGSSTP